MMKIFFQYAVTAVTMLGLFTYVRITGRKILIIAEQIGRLGNRLLLFSKVIGFGIENNFEVWNLGFHDYARYFKYTREDLFCGYPPRNRLFKCSFLRRLAYHMLRITASKITTIPLSGNHIGTFYARSTDSVGRNIDDEVFTNYIKNKKIVFIDGYFLTGSSSFKYKKEIQKYFEPREEYSRSAAECIIQLKKDCEILLGITIRHGDYRLFRGGKYFFSLDEYVSVMYELEKLFPDKKVGFFISSDEEQDTSKFSEFNFIFHTNRAIEDVCILSQCDYILGPPSSYPAWCAFYGDVPIYVMKSLDNNVSLKSFSRI